MVLVDLEVIEGIWEQGELDKSLILSSKMSEETDQGVSIFERLGINIGMDI